MTVADNILTNIEKISSADIYDTDKIVFSITGSISIASLPDEYNAFGYIIKRLTIPHGFTRPLFPRFRFSVDGGASWRTGGGAESSIAYSTSSNINLLLLPDLTGTFMYEVFGSWIDNYDTSNPDVDNISVGDFIYDDSRLNYRKILLQDVVMPSTPLFTDFIIEKTISHPLSYAPFVTLYFESRPGEIWQSHAGGTKNPWVFEFGIAECFFYSRPLQLFTSLSGIIGDPLPRMWYKIYADR